MKNISHPSQKHKLTRQTQQYSSCFCFKSNKNPTSSSNSKINFQNQPDHTLKDQALKLSRQIAQNSFKHLKKVHLLTKNTFSQNKALQTTKQFLQNIKQLQLSKNPKQDDIRKYEKVNASDKDEFNMSRITFSVVNKSYEKTVNNTVSSNNTSINSESNILSSMMSQVKNDGHKIKTYKQSHDESFSSISSINKRNSGKGVRAQVLSKKGIRLINTINEIEPIKEENEEVETKKFKFIRVKAKNLPPKPTKIDEEKRLQIKRIQTEEQLQQSGYFEEDENVKYDYSSILIDFFNMGPQTLEERNQNEQMQNILEQQSVQILPNNTTSPINQIISLANDGSSISRETSFSSLTSYNPVQSVQSISNIRFNFVPSASFDSNVLSMSLNNNFSECSFESIAKKQIKCTYKGYEGFDGLSCINEKEESEVEGKNESQIEQGQVNDQYGNYNE